MDGEVRLRTEHLVLRRWRPADREPFAALNSDPEVMEHLHGLMSREESDSFVDRIEADWRDRDFGLWAVEVPDEADLIGYVGLAVHPFMPTPEIGWRLARPFWGRGFATEGARAVLADGFDRLGLTEIVSFTIPDNVRSTRVMERLGMTHDPNDDFDHPRFPPGHRLSRHVLYRIDRERWLRTLRA
jgi:RimJ/RimL family protein N-acetyltransferase